MPTVSCCPHCQRQVTILDGMAAAAVVRCPLCQGEFPLAELLAMLPPALVAVAPIEAPEPVAATLQTVPPASDLALAEPPLPSATPPAELSPPPLPWPAPTDSAVAAAPPPRPAEDFPLAEPPPAPAAASDDDAFWAAVSSAADEKPVSAGEADLELSFDPLDELTPADSTKPAQFAEASAERVSPDSSDGSAGLDFASEADSAAELAFAPLDESPAEEEPSIFDLAPQPTSAKAAAPGGVATLHPATMPKAATKKTRKAAAKATPRTVPRTSDGAFPFLMPAPRKRHPLRKAIGVVVGGLLGLVLGYFALTTFGGSQYDFLHVLSRPAEEKAAPAGKAKPRAPAASTSSSSEFHVGYASA